MTVSLSRRRLTSELSWSLCIFNLMAYSKPIGMTGVLKDMNIDLLALILGNLSPAELLNVSKVQQGPYICFFRVCTIGYTNICADWNLLCRKGIQDFCLCL